jgi:TonB-dependent SusC/RagA subfamily outer membrane receptor
VLKDADATAIYGSRGGNGVLLITTKKGKRGKTTVDFNTYTGLGKLTRLPKMLNLQQYLEMRREAKKTIMLLLHFSIPISMEPGTRIAIPIGRKNCLVELLR